MIQTHLRDCIRTVSIVAVAKVDRLLKQKDEEINNMKNKIIKWITTNGGPFIALNVNDSTKWKGVDDFHYQKACELDSYVTQMQFSDFFGIVFGDEPLETALYMSHIGLFLVQWSTAENELDILECLKHLQTEKLGVPVESTQIQINTPIIIFDSALNFSGFEKEIEINSLYIPREVFFTQIDTFEYSSSLGISLLLHRFSNNVGISKTKS